MATLEEIALAIKQIDAKRDDLKKAYDDLQSHSSSLLSSFALSWSDLDAHFTHIANSLTHRFRLLQNVQSTHLKSPQVGYPSHSQSSPVKDPHLLTESGVSQPSQPTHDPVDSVPAQSLSVEESKSCGGEKTRIRVETGVSSQDRADSVVTRPELWGLCESMDGRGLIKYINGHSKVRESIRMELREAIKVAPDAGLMVLEAMDVFYAGNKEVRGDNDPDRRSCVLLLEVLMGIDVEIGSEVNERAKRLAFEWRGKVRVGGESSLEALGFLHLVAAYGLGNEFDRSDFVEYLLHVARYRQGALLCKAIDLGDKVQDLIQKLIEHGKQLLAVKYIFEFKLTDKYPPVPLLKAYVNKSKKLAQGIRRDGQNSLRAQNEAAAKEVSAYKAVIKIIEDYELESVYPKEGYEKRIQQLEKQKADRKRPAEVRLQRQPQKPQQNAKKRSRTAAPVGHAQGVAGANSTIPPFRQPRVQPASLPDNSAAYLNSVAGPFSLVGSAPSISSYAGSSSLGPYGLTGGPIGLPGNSRHPVYSSEPHIPSGYYDRLTAYGGYNLPPQYHSSYYPQ